MGSSAEQFDAWFKERLGQFEEPPRKAAWENIAEKLGHTRKKRVMVFILRIAAGMALTLSLGLAYYYTVQHRSISVPPSLTENQLSRPAKVKMPAAAGSKDLPETVSSLSHNSSDVQSEIFPLSGAAPAGITNQAAPTAAEENDNKALLSRPSGFPAEINPLPARIGDKSVIPGLAFRKVRNGPKILSETDLIMTQNLAQMNAGGEGKNKHNAWIVGGQLAPLYSYRNLSWIIRVARI
jgi:hypothetical protein